jgi:hypothetical protein
MSEREPAPEKIRLPEIKEAVEKAFPGAHIDMQNAIGGGGFVEASFDDYALRVLLTGPVAATRKTSIRFVQRVGRNGKTVQLVFEEKTEDWYEILDSIQRARAIVNGIIHNLRAALTPKKSAEIKSINDLFTKDL